MGLIYLSSVPGALSGASIGSAVVNTSTGTGYIESGGIWIAFTATSMSLALLTRYLVVRSDLFRCVERETSSGCTGRTEAFRQGLAFVFYAYSYNKRARSSRAPRSTSRSGR